MQDRLLRLVRTGYRLTLLHISLQYHRLLGLYLVTRLVYRRLHLCALGLLLLAGTQLLS